jgi:Zn ribbon nucleic-acid-binding protein
VARARSLCEFQKAFPDETRCAAFLFQRRWPDGCVCPACGKRRAVALKSRPRLYECLHCGRQTSITATTAMHRSKLPLTTWFWAAHLMATHFQRDVGAAIGGSTQRHLQDRLAPDAEAAALDG